MYDIRVFLFSIIKLKFFIMYANCEFIIKIKRKMWYLNFVVVFDFFSQRYIKLCSTPIRLPVWLWKGFSRVNRFHFLLFHDLPADLVGAVPVCRKHAAWEIYERMCSGCIGMQTFEIPSPPQQWDFLFVRSVAISKEWMNTKKKKKEGKKVVYKM